MKTRYIFITLIVCLLFGNVVFGQDNTIDSLERRITALEHKVAFNQVSNDFTHLSLKIENRYNEWRVMVLSNDRKGLNAFYSSSSRYNESLENNYASLKLLYRILDSDYNFTYEENDVINSAIEIIDIGIDQLKSIDKEHSKRW